MKRIFIYLFCGLSLLSILVGCSNDTKTNEKEDLEYSEDVVDTTGNWETILTANTWVIEAEEPGQVDNYIEFGKDGSYRQYGTELWPGTYTIDENNETVTIVLDHGETMERRLQEGYDGQVFLSWSNDGTVYFNDLEPTYLTIDKVMNQVSQ